MNRRLKKLIEEKAWETLTEHGYNDSQLFEQLRRRVASNFISEQSGEEQSVQSIDGLVFYFPFSFSNYGYDGGSYVGNVYAGGLVFGEDAFNEQGRAALERQLDEWWNSGGDIDDFVPDFSDPDFLGGLNLQNAEMVIRSAQVNMPPTPIDESREIAAMKLMTAIRTIGGGAIPVSAIEGLSRAATGRRGNPELRELLQIISKEIRRRVDRDYDLPKGTSISIPRFGDNPFFRPPGGEGGFSGKGSLPSDFRASRGGFGGLGGPGGGRMAPPSQPPQQRMPRMPGQGFGGGQGMPTPGFAPPTPPLG